MLRSRRTLAGLTGLAIVSGSCVYGLLSLGRGEGEDAPAVALRRLHRDLNDQIELLPSMTSAGARQDVLGSLTSFCGRYWRDVEAFSEAGQRAPSIRARLSRAGHLIDEACRVQGRLRLDTPAETLKSSAIEFKTRAQPALLEVQSAFIELSSQNAESRRRRENIAFVKLLGLLALSAAGFVYLAWRTWPRPGELPSQTPGTPFARADELSGQWMRTAMEASSEGILIVEPEGIIRSANIAAERILGFARGELFGMQAASVIPSLATAGKEPYGILEHVTVVKKDAPERQCQISWFRRKGVENVPTVVFVQNSLDPQPAAPAPRSSVETMAGPVELDAASLQLLENEILLVTGFAEVALSSLRPADPARADLDQVTRAAARAAALCREAAAQTQKAPLELTSLNAFFAGFEHRLTAMLDPGIEVESRMDPAAGAVSVNATMLEQALLSLILHALPSAPEPRGIRLATLPGGRIDVTLTAAGGSAPRWRRAIGGELPRAAQPLAQQGATLEQDTAENGGGRRFRIRLALAAASEVA